jgi:hypothetical protein
MSEVSSAYDNHGYRQNTPEDFFPAAGTRMHGSHMISPKVFWNLAICEGGNVYLELVSPAKKIKFNKISSSSY